MIEDLNWFGIRWKVGPESAVTSLQNSDFEIFKDNNEIQNSFTMKNKKIKTDDIFYSEILIAKNVIKNNNSNDIIDKYTNMICAHSFFGVHLSLYVNVFHQSKRMELYKVGLKQLFALGLGILFYVNLLQFIQFYVVLFCFISLFLFCFISLVLFCFISLVSFYFISLVSFVLFH